MKVSFYLHNQLDTTGRAAIYCRYSHLSEDFRFPVRYANEGGVIRINPQSWIKSNADLQSKIKARKASRKDAPFRVKKDHPLSRIINQSLDNTESEIYTLCNDLLLARKTPFTFEVKAAYQALNQKVDFFAVFDRFILEKKKVSKKATIKNFLTLETVLSVYNESSKIHINRMDNRFLLSFREYLSDNGVSIASIRSYVARVKTFLAWALDNGFIANDKFKKWKVENQVAIHSYLTPANIRDLMDAQLNEWEALARDLLLFSCFTGLRAGEINSLTPLSVRNGVLTVETGKVKGKAKRFRQVKLNGLSLPIWERLLDKPIRVSSTIRAKIKDACKKAQLDEMILTTSGERAKKYTDVSMNTGRRTFITLCNQFEIPENFIALIVGHSRSSMTSHYDKTETAKAFNYMDKWEECYLKAVS